MMNQFSKITLFFSLIVLGSGNAWSKEVQVISKGLDGSMRYYEVVCPDGSRSSVTQYYQIPEETIDRETIISNMEKGINTTDNIKPAQLIKICVETDDGEQSCRDKWALRAAAENSCK